MAQEELEIEIGPDGKVTVRTIGIKGARCLEVAEIVALVGQEESRQMTSEYYEARTDVHQQTHVHRRT